MVRRVGFGDDGDGRPPRDRTTRTKPPPKIRRTLAELSRPKRGRTTPLAEAATARAPLLARLFIGGFLLVWLTGWSAGIVFAIGAFLGEFGDFGDGGDLFVRGFLFVWISFALIGWWFAARALLRIVRGQPLRATKSKP